MPGDVVGIVFLRVRHRFAHLDEGREMHDGIDLVAGETRVELLGAVRVALEEVAPPDVLAVAGDKAVEHHRMVAPGGEFLAAMSADVAGAAGDEDVHR